MTSPPDPDPDEIARLKKQLADATAQVEEVRAELEGSTGQPIVIQSGPVDLQGHPVDLDEALGAERAAQVREALAGAGFGDVLSGTSRPGGQPPRQPIVIQSGPVDLQGNPVDLDEVLGAERAAQVRATLGGLGNAMPAPNAPAAAALADLARLADPPRPVPFTFRVATFAWSWWEAFSLFLGAVAPIVVWGFFPELIPSALISAIVVIGYIRGLKAARRLGLVKRGKVATVTNSDELDRGTYYSGTTYSNMWVTQAHGWDVTRRIYSGPASKTRIEYAVDGVPGSFTLRGLPYEGGVILARPDRPVALCVNQFVYDVKPGADGQMVGGLRAWTWVGVVGTLLMESALVAGAIYSVQTLWL